MFNRSGFIYNKFNVITNNHVMYETTQAFSKLQSIIVTCREFLNLIFGIRQQF